MFARGAVSLHAAQLLVPKTLTSKSPVSITYKLIQNNGLQLHYFRHLRKTGGRGSYRLVHATHHPAELRAHAQVRPSQKRTSPLCAASANLCVLSVSALDFLFVRSSLSAVDCGLSANCRASKPFVSPTYAKTRGYAPVENVGAPTFLIFPHIFRTFLQAVRQPAIASAKARSPFRRRKCDHSALNSIQWRITGCRCLQKPSLEEARNE
jgi:hypothetical protein